MKLRRVIYKITLLSLACSLPIVAQLQSKNSYSNLAGAPFRMGFSSRGISFGNAVSSLTDGTVPAYYNPALLSYCQQSSFMATYGILSLDRSLNAISFMQHINPNAGFSLFILNTGISDIDGRDINGYHTETFSTSENLFGFSFALQPSTKLSIGVTIKVLYYSLYQSIKSTTAGFDVGAVYKLYDELSLGLVIQDINSKYKWDTSKLYGEEGKSTIDRFPLRRKIALAYQPHWAHITVAGEYERIEKESLVRLGAEFSPVKNFAIRSGVDEITFSRTFDPTPSFGASFRTEVFHMETEFQYTYSIERYTPNNIHYLTLYLKFL